MSRKWIVTLGLALVLAALHSTRATAAAQAATAADSTPKKASTEDAAPKPPADGLKERELSVPKGKPAEIWKFVEKARADAAEAQKNLNADHGAEPGSAVPRLDQAERSVVKGCEAILQTNPSPELASKAALAELQALVVLSQLVGGSYKDQLLEFAQTVEDKYPESEAAPAAGIQGMMARIRKVMEAKRGDWSATAEAVVSEARRFVRKYPRSPAAPEVLFALGSQLEQLSQNDHALTLYQILVDQFPKSPLSGRVAGAIRRLDLPGKPLELRGPLVSGGKIDVGTLKGKVVLIDFWATWCGPCRQELPEVKEANAKLHKRGFEIVGVSLDNDADTLKDFLKQEKMDWPQIFFSAADEQGWKNPIIDHFGINAIPAMFLVGTDGKVVSTAVHGSQVRKAVEKLLKASPSQSAETLK